MKQPTPEELLKEKLDGLTRARDKSILAFEEGTITQEEHDIHMTNLTSLIEDYKYTIRVVNQYK
jgi:hypothetical protein